MRWLVDQSRKLRRIYKFFSNSRDSIDDLWGNFLKSLHLWQIWREMRRRVRHVLTSQWLRKREIFSRNWSESLLLLLFFSTTIERSRFAWRRMLSIVKRVTYLIRRARTINDILLRSSTISSRKQKFVETRTTKNFMRLFWVSRIDDTICRIASTSSTWSRITTIFATSWRRRSSMHVRCAELKN